GRNDRLGYSQTPAGCRYPGIRDQEPIGPVESSSAPLYKRGFRQIRRTGILRLRRSRHKTLLTTETQGHRNKANCFLFISVSLWLELTAAPLCVSLMPTYNWRVGFTGCGRQRPDCKGSPRGSIP